MKGSCAVRLVRWVRGLLARAPLALALVALIAATPPGAGDPLRPFVDRLTRQGRGEATLERTVPDPLGGPARTVRGGIALEPPDRASLEFPATGERVTLRGDGGEWLQPALRQMLVLKPEHADQAKRWWQSFLGRETGLERRRLGSRNWLLIRPAAEGTPADTAWVWLDARGLPARIELRETGEGRTIYRLSGWRFSGARGRRAFTLTAPAGYESVPMP